MSGFEWSEWTSEPTEIEVKLELKPPAGRTSCVREGVRYEMEVRRTSYPSGEWFWSMDIVAKAGEMIEVVYIGPVWGTDAESSILAKIQLPKRSAEAMAFTLIPAFERGMKMGWEMAMAKELDAEVVG